jgi:DNA mismatch repair protein MSH4
MSQAHPGVQRLLRDASEAGGGGAASGVGGSAGGDAEGAVVVALIQNRAGEVGLAALDARASTLWLAQFVETTRSFSTTRGLLDVRPPSALLVVAAPGARAGPAECALHAALRVHEQLPLPRGAWDDTAGLVLLRAVAAPGAPPELLRAGRGAYLAHGAAGALLTHLRDARGLALAPAALAVRAAAPAHLTRLDAAAADALELVRAARAGPPGARRGATLLALLDGTRTRAGGRLLRATLLQPLRDVPTLEARYDALAELRVRPELLLAVDGGLAALPANPDAVLGALALRPAARGDAAAPRRVAAAVGAVLSLRELLRSLPPLAEALGGARAELLAALRAAAGAGAFAALAARLDALLDDEALPARGAFLNRTQQCFALRAGLDPLLDVSRAAFCRATEQVHELAEALRARHALPGLRVSYAARRGFFFVLAAPARGKRGRRGGDDDGDGDDAEGGENGGGGGGGNGGAAAGVPPPPPPRLPPGFTLLGRAAGGRAAPQATSPELAALNARLAASGDDCLRITEALLDAALAEALAGAAPLLRRLTDGLALLDMLAGFAKRLAATGFDYVRPALTARGPIAFQGLRHAVLEAADADRPFRANDAWLALDASLHVVTVRLYYFYFIILRESGGRRLACTSRRCCVWLSSLTPVR